MTPGIREILDKDTEALITDIIAYYRNGAEGEPIVPEALLGSDPYNREIMELFREVADLADRWNGETVRHDQYRRIKNKNERNR